MKTLMFSLFATISLASTSFSTAQETSSSGLSAATQPGLSWAKTFDQLPPAVQSTVRGQAGVAPIESIRQEAGTGPVVYDVVFKHNGQPVKLRINAEGHILNENSASPPPKRIPLSAPVKVTFEQLPQTVQKTLRACAGTSAIENIDKGTVQGKTVYQADFPHAGQNVELRIAEDGSLIKDQDNERVVAKLKTVPNQQESAGRAAVGQSGTGNGGSPADESGLTQLQPVSFAALPLPVVSRLQSEAGAVAIQKLERGLWNGKPVYRAMYQQEGKQIEILIGQDGSLVAAPVIR
jgi:hypothetical protein